MKEVVFITGPWCSTCKAMKPKIDEICKNKSITMKILDMVENENEIVPLFPTALPTIIINENNNEMARFSGTVTIRDIERML